MAIRNRGIILNQFLALYEVIPLVRYKVSTAYRYSIQHGKNL